MSPRVLSNLNVALKVSTIVALLGAPVGAYVAVASRLAVIMAKLDDHTREMLEYKREAATFRQELFSLRLADSGLATAERLGQVEQRVENHEVRLRTIEKTRE